MRSLALTLLLTAIATSAGVVACREEGPAERAGQAIDQAGEDASEAVDDAGDAIEDAAETASEKAHDAVD